MKTLKASEIRKMDSKAIESKKEEIFTELMKLRTQKSSGAAPEKPSRIKELKRTIARIKTVRREIKKK